MLPSATTLIPGTRPLATLLCALFAAACGGGGGGGDGGGGDGGGGSSGINGSLAGTMYFDSASQYVAFDVKTGASTTIYPASGDGTTPSADASEFVNIQNTPNKTTTYNTQDVVVFKRDGTVTARFTFDNASTSGTGYPSELTGFPKMSPNGTLIAESYGNSSPVTGVFDRNGTQQASLAGVTSYSWTPDNRLAVIKSEAVYITSGSLALGGTPVKSFSGMAPSNVAVSPDGSRIAVTLQSSSASLDYHVWVMNSDGSNLHQVTTSDLGEGRAGWSPDNTKLAVIKGQVSGGGTSGGTCPELWAVPADASKASLASTPTGGAQAIAQVDSGTTRTSTCAFSLPYWLN